MVWAVLVDAQSGETLLSIDEAVGTQLARSREAHNGSLGSGDGAWMTRSTVLSLTEQPVGLAEFPHDLLGCVLSLLH
jgi:hypothetical protein